MYAGKSKEERDALQQFFTPADLTIQMLEALDETKEEFIKSDVLDPTSGSGNLLSAALLIGARVNGIFGNEYDADMSKLCVNRIRTIPERLINSINNSPICEFIQQLYNNAIDKQIVITTANKLKTNLDDFNDWQIHQGNALQTRCLTDFSEEYSGKRDSSGHVLPHYNPDYIDDQRYAQSNNSWRWENEQAKRRAALEEASKTEFNSLF